MNSQSMRSEEFETAAAALAGSAADAVSRRPVVVLEELLTQSIQLRDMYKNARWQVPSGQFGELRRILEDHYKEQLSLIDVIVDRIRVLGGAVGVFASEFLQSTRFCRLLRGPRALNRLLHDFLEAHESVLSAARPHDSNGDHQWMRDFAVGRVVLTNEQQCESINGMLLRNDPQQRLLQSDV
jgi:starvation-inducible DNA-binding protein